MDEANSISHTILIPTKDRPALLQRAVKSALDALVEGGEILVVDEDGREIVRRLSRGTLAATPEQPYRKSQG